MHAPRDPRPVTPPLAELEACAAMLRQGSRTFHAASKLLPARVRAPAIALYAFCRQADDAVDVAGSAEALAALHRRLARAAAGAPDDGPVDRAFAWALSTYGVPVELPTALLEGFAWDLEGRRCATLSDLRAYAARVAGSVGAMMAVLMGTRDPVTLACACELGIAMQLTNVARDVGEDARMGRCYLPLAWMREEGVDADAWLAAPALTPAIARLTGRVLDAADRHYAAAAPGIARLPLDCRAGISVAARLYAEIGEEVRRAGLDSVTRRAVVSASRKAALVSLAAFGSVRVPSAAADDVTPSPEATYLVSAARQAPPPAPRGLEARVSWLVDLFERLERRESGESLPESRAAPAAQA
jgi:15-cis-phytoene synthase